MGALQIGTTKESLETRLSEAANGVRSLKTELGDFGLCDEAASELKARASRLEELEKALDRAIGQFERLADIADSCGAWGGAISELANEGICDLQTLSHPDKERS